ncbi:MAG: hypothetical protein KDN19_00575 [Verrucomicrobiae bacterium]|nr:hypothetical protein [Verrucomicrobiae bacterium]
MRGFPLLSTVFVLAVFAAAWWPLKQTATGSGAISSPPADSPSAATATTEDGVASTVPATLRIMASAPLASLRVEWLGEVLIDETAPRAGGVLEHELPTLAIPEEGVEFWIEATFTESADSRPSALGIELAPDDREARTVTLWTDESDPNSVADSVVFTWNP